MLCRCPYAVLVLLVACGDTAGADSGGGASALVDAGRVSAGEATAADAGSTPTAEAGLATAEDGDAGPDQAMGGGGSGNAGGGGGGGTSVTDTDCVVAVRLDYCCGATAAVTVAELEADRCLVLYPTSELDSDLSVACQNRSGVNCAVADCAPTGPPSRIAISDGARGCRFGDECEISSDCVLASDLRPCCGCPGPWPRAVVERDSCLVEAGEGDVDPACMACDSSPSCGACEEIGRIVCTRGLVFAECATEP